ncbi:MAG: ral secretion pathway protein [Deltaproteobacteria bacterium]|nr:ral secretion pathway protein [Deltaproteobacteria bacterium]
MKNVTAGLLFLIVASLSNAQAQNRGGAFAAVPAPGQVPAPAVTPQLTTPTGPGVPRPAAQPQPGQQQQEQLRIVADPATNSLIIYGTNQEYQNIKNILKELDAIPRQVLIEALILQVDLKDSEDFGVDYELFRKSRQTIFGKTFGSSAALTTLGKLFPGAPAFSGVGGLSAIAGDNTVSAMIRAAATNSRIKLISSPSVIASDNRPARIQVGSEEPIPTGTVQSPVSGGTITSSTTVQYRNTGRILTIIPQVNSQGLVNLQIKAEVSARGDDVKVGQDSFPAFNTQDAETTAVVHDGETLVIGGLIGERKSRGRSGIPYLMDIPVIGRFFGTTSDSADRTELIMLITPTVIRNRVESRVVTAEFKAGLEKVRTELEVLEKERARLMPPRPLPPMPNPDMMPTIPQPSPSNVIPGRGASLAPSTGDVSAFSNYGPVAGEMSIDALRERLETQNLAAVDNRGYGQLGRDQIPQPTSERETPARPLYALSIAPVPMEPNHKPASQAKQQPTQPKKIRIWAVQVAALSNNKAAEAVADQLRKNGYKAYVMMTQGEYETWHRVRVGQFENHQEAVELRKALIVNEQFQQAYVAVN